MNAITLAAVVAASLLAGCKKGGADASEKMIEFKDLMCRCKAGDAACADKVLAEQARWAVETAKSSDKNATPDPEAAKKLEPITVEYTKCLAVAKGQAEAVAPDQPKP